MKHPLPIALGGFTVVMCLAAALAGQIGIAPTAASAPAGVHPRVAASASAPSSVAGQQHTVSSGSYAASAPAARMIGVAGEHVADWNRQTGVRASLSEFYISMAAPVQPAWMRWAESNADGARPIIEILPHGHTLQSIINGRADPWLRSLKAEINERVVISFSPEANGHWYPWGGQPALFRAAWRHVWSVIGTHDVTWLWQMSARKRVTAYWPGRRYVTWAGLDGYFDRPSDTFQSIFGPDLASIRRVAAVPVLVSETAAGPLTGHVAADIRSLFTGLQRNGIVAVVWFDLAQDQPPFHQDWHLTPGTAAMTAFRHGAARFLQASP